MKRLKPDKKKKPSDYPLLSFRTTEEDKDELETMIERVQTAFNKGLDKDEVKPFKKNSIAIQALRLGLDEMLKKIKS